MSECVLDDLGIGIIRGLFGLLGRMSIDQVISWEDPFLFLCLLLDRLRYEQRDFHHLLRNLRTLGGGIRGDRRPFLIRETEARDIRLFQRQVSHRTLLLR